MTDLHETIYGDIKRVREMRVQAQGRVAWRHIKQALVYSWAEPVAIWLSKRLSRS